MNHTDTIFALSSGRLPAGVAVIRLSGPRVRFAFETIFGSVPEPRLLSYGALRNLDGQLLDRGLVAYFSAPNSFTGEDCGEFHVHGSIAVVRALCAVLSSFDDVRQAEPGEFTQRAFMNGKLDLTQAEGLGDLIAAETEAQRRLALRQSEGEFRRLYEGWRGDLVQVRAMVEAAIDFSEEDDVSTNALADIGAGLMQISGDISRHISGYRHAEIIRDGFNVVILGAPNSGKSTLINALAGREAAITADEAGTTRDLIDVRLVLSGNLVVITDTAGIRENAGYVETIGIDRALKRAHAADLVLLVEDVSSPASIGVELPVCPVLRIGNKVDVSGSFAEGYDFLISAKNGEGLTGLLAHIAVMASENAGSAEMFAVQERQMNLLSSAKLEIDACGHLGERLDLLAEHLRLATNYVGRLTGRVDVEELLGVIFAKFCIGK